MDVAMSAALRRRFGHDSQTTIKPRAAPRGSPIRGAALGGGPAAFLRLA